MFCLKFVEHNVRCKKGHIEVRQKSRVRGHSWGFRDSTIISMGMFILYEFKSNTEKRRWVDPR